MLHGGRNAIIGAPEFPCLSMTDLAPLHQAIDDRVARIRQEQPDWPCGKGCDQCCRSLADVPRLTPSEWSLLQSGLETLTADALASIRMRVRTMARGANGYMCPLLDTELGICPVYAHRPVACRTYGYYVERDRGLYCRDIERRVDAGEMADVVWGNQAAVEQAMRTDGPAQPLTAWFDQAGGVGPHGDAPGPQG